MFHYTILYFGINASGVTSIECIQWGASSSENNSRWWGQKCIRIFYSILPYRIELFKLKGMISTISIHEQGNLFVSQMHAQNWSFSFNQRRPIYIGRQFAIVYQALTNQSPKVSYSMYLKLNFYQVLLIYIFIYKQTRPSFIQILSCCLFDDKQLPTPMMTSF